MNLWDAGLMLLMNLWDAWFLMSCSLFKNSIYFFSYDSPYTHFVQCVEYNNGEQSRLLIPAIQNLVSQILPLYPDVDLRSW
jgi:hypothetical protein